MGNPIVKLEGSYLIWSTIVDAPITFGGTRKQLEARIREEHGRRGVEELVARLERVEAKGTSSRHDESADDTIFLNRAGPREAPLAREEIVEFYVRRKEEPTEKSLAEFRQSAGAQQCQNEECLAFREDRSDCGPACPCWHSGWWYPGKEPK